MVCERYPVVVSVVNEVVGGACLMRKEGVAGRACCRLKKEMSGKGEFNTGAQAASKTAKPVQTVRFQEGIEDHLEAKARGDRSRFFKDGSE